MNRKKSVKHISSKILAVQLKDSGKDVINFAIVTKILRTLPAKYGDLCKPGCQKITRNIFS